MNGKFNSEVIGITKVPGVCLFGHVHRQCFFVYVCKSVCVSVCVHLPEMCSCQI